MLTAELETNEIEALRQWLQQCPMLSNENPFRINFLNDEEEEYSIQQTPSALRYNENVLGEFIPSRDQTINFTLRMRLPYGKDVSQNLMNTGFCQEIVLWIIARSREQDFPKFVNGRVVAILPTLSPYISESGPDTAIYQITLQVSYKLNR